MSLKIQDYKQMTYPYKLLLEGNADAHSQLYSVVETFKDEHLSYKNPDVKSRTCGEIISHTVCTQSCFFTNSLVLGKKEKCECKVPASIDDALKMIQGNLMNMSKTWQDISVEELETEITTEWGQIMSKELALFQSIEHFMYHVGELCFLAGMGGFYQGTLG